MLIARITKRGAARILDGREGQFLPVHHAFKRTPDSGLEGWVIAVADFSGKPDGGYVPFAVWSLAPEDYDLFEVTYKNFGWRRTAVLADAALPAFSGSSSRKGPRDTVRATIASAVATFFGKDRDEGEAAAEHIETSLVEAGFTFSKPTLADAEEPYNPKPPTSRFDMEQE